MAGAEEQKTQAAFKGGLPLVVVPDNCKTAVSKANYYDPQLNKAYYDLALKPLCAFFELAE